MTLCTAVFGKISVHGSIWLIPEPWQRSFVDNTRATMSGCFIPDTNHFLFVLLPGKSSWSINLHKSDGELISLSGQNETTFPSRSISTELSSKS